MGKETRITDITDLQVDTIFDEDTQKEKYQISYKKDGRTMKINVDKKHVSIWGSETGKPYIIKSKVKKETSVMEMLLSFSTFNQDTVYQVFE